MSAILFVVLLCVVGGGAEEKESVLPSPAAEAIWGCCAIFSIYLSRLSEICSSEAKIGQAVFSASAGGDWVGRCLDFGAISFPRH